MSSSEKSQQAHVARRQGQVGALPGPGGGRAGCGPESKAHMLSPLPQLWYFWRRRLFIWISFLDSYFELLLYVASPLLRLRP